MAGRGRSESDMSNELNLEVLNDALRHATDALEYAIAQNQDVIDLLQERKRLAEQINKSFGDISLDEFRKYLQRYREVSDEIQRKQVLEVRQSDWETYQQSQDKLREQLRYLFLASDDTSSSDTELRHSANLAGNPIILPGVIQIIKQAQMKLKYYLEKMRLTDTSTLIEIDVLSDIVEHISRVSNAIYLAFKFAGLNIDLDYLNVTDIHPNEMESIKGSFLLDVKKPVNCYYRIELRLRAIKTVSRLEPHQLLWGAPFLKQCLESIDENINDFLTWAENYHR
jgi:hypothetical protein